jgi:hypothetical protein
MWAGSGRGPPRPCEQRRPLPRSRWRNSVRTVRHRPHGWVPASSRPAASAAPCHSVSGRTGRACARSTTDRRRAGRCSAAMPWAPIRPRSAPRRGAAPRVPRCAGAMLVLRATYAPTYVIWLHSLIFGALITSARASALPLGRREVGLAARSEGCIGISLPRGRKHGCPMHEADPGGPEASRTAGQAPTAIRPQGRGERFLDPGPQPMSSNPPLPRHQRDRFFP